MHAMACTGWEYLKGDMVYGLTALFNVAMPDPAHCSGTSMWRWGTVSRAPSCRCGSSAPNRTSQCSSHRSVA